MPGLVNSRKRASLSPPPPPSPRISPDSAEEAEGHPIVVTPLRTPLPILGAITAGGEEEGGNCVTPKGKDYDLKPTLVCPPAPRKPRQAMRRFSRPVRELFIVTCDFESVFPIIAAPPKKKLHVG